ncbi:hypothetical protein GNI_137300 [Gregarina niphandrodes]|uniref:Apple domain-containing protein n=1 Tax=Gregarina niphandrodes TaxID=110365 RepID=A0A023B0P6_GRENI|nr:hypothetical protein GNI_137300 [Gregarina niphandrodes]EZG45708.1 hypothetical protein GNI_137300 [Gregarina niphandrodes]|eukprot:XP_011132462.1 hypothetical protein GNI_137300 [Gregarina niphandrodes]
MSCWIQCNDIKATGGNPLDDPSFNSDCSVEKIEMVDGVVASTGSCFDSWIFGYADPPELAGFYHNDTSTSAAKCQLLCQSDDRCVRFQFTTTSLGMSTAGVPSYRCVLKNADQVVSILEGDPGGQGFNSDICDTQSTNGCSTVGDCLKCGGMYEIPATPSTPVPSTTATTTELATTTTTKATTTTTRPVTVTIKSSENTTTTGGGGNGAKIATGVVSAAGGLAPLGGALRYFNRPAEDTDAAFVADEAQMPELREREAAATRHVCVGTFFWDGQYYSAV